jgi:hypothetical protein
MKAAERTLMKRASLIAALALAFSCGAPSTNVAPVPPATARAAAQSAQPEAPLAFALKEGRTDNRFLRSGKVAAHVLVTSGDAPRVVFAFPAGNMGIGLWLGGPSDLALQGDVTAVERPDGMRGVTVTVHATGKHLFVKQAILGSIRALRDFGHDGKVPPGFEHEVVAKPSFALRRHTLDERWMELGIEPLAGTKVEMAEDHSVSFDGQGSIAVKLTALSNEPPLTPVRSDAIVTSEAADDPRALSALTFLTYEEKILAGSWQYLTYFGRDTLLSTRLLMPVLKPAAIEAALGAVIERLDPEGDVSHEEDIGEWAVFENTKASPRPADPKKPRYDYKMVDDDFMLAPVLASYVESEVGRARAESFLARRTTAGKTFAEAVRKNLDRVVVRATPFAEKPSRERLVAILPGLPVGNWRDSVEGLGNGRVPYDVNAALVPAALRAAERLYDSAPLGHDKKAAARAGDLARAWSAAEPLFTVKIEAEEAKRRVRAYAKEQGVDDKAAIDSITGPVSFPALSLDAKGAPVPIQHSDDGFVMTFTDPSSAWLASAASRITSPFPAGLRTPVGIVVANPAYATDPALRGIFTRNHYHGTVVWSWQQALLMTGLRRQLARTDITKEARAALEAADRALASVIDATKAMRTSELWSFNVDANGWHVVPFGQGAGHHTEANAVQLWSTVYLAVDRRAPK